MGERQRRTKMSKKLSNKELLKELDKAVGIKIIAYEQIKSLIEAQAEPLPTNCPHAYKMLDRAESLWCDDCVRRLLKAQEPSEKELEEFKSKWRGKIHNSIGKQMFSLPLKLLDEMLQEYDKLRRG